MAARNACFAQLKQGNLVNPEIGFTKYGEPGAELSAPGRLIVWDATLARGVW
jgi:hypothetical protein